MTHQSFKKPFIELKVGSEACGILNYPYSVTEFNAYLTVDTKSHHKKFPTCTELKNFKPHMRILKHGKALVTNSLAKHQELGLQTGDFVNVIFSHGEGFVEICFGDHTDMAYASLGPSGSGSSESIVSMLEQPQTEDWFQFSNKEKTYWSLLHNQPNPVIGYYDDVPKEDFCK